MNAMNESKGLSSDPCRDERHGVPAVRDRASFGEILETLRVLKLQSEVAAGCRRLPVC